MKKTILFYLCNIGRFALGRGYVFKMRKQYWKIRKNSNNISYDFKIPKFWNDENLKLENEKIINEIENKEISWYPWISEINKIPKNLVEVLMSELKSGNFISSISNDNWPQNGSVVIKMNGRFKEESRNFSATKWRLLNDPHY